MTPIREPWLEWRSPEQNDLLQASCRDLSQQVRWDGVRLSQDEWRWLVCADILGQKPVRGIHGGIVLLGGSSRKLTKDDCSQAITLVFSIGDAPWEYGCPKDHPQVKWCSVVRMARGITDEEMAA